MLPLFGKGIKLDTLVLTYVSTYEQQNLFTEGAMKNEVLQFSLTPQISVTYLETSVFRCKQ